MVANFPKMSKSYFRVHFMVLPMDCFGLRPVNDGFSFSCFVLREMNTVSRSSFPILR
jgi:hypothetical protein